MVVDRIENGGNYAPLGARIARFQRYTSVAGEGRFYEAHRRYIDIQYIASGSERIRVRDLDELEEQTPYDAERDVAFYRQAPGTDVILRAGEFAILYPHEAHLPMMPVDKPAEVSKVVVKVQV